MQQRQQDDERPSDARQPRRAEAGPPRLRGRPQRASRATLYPLTAQGLLGTMGRRGKPKRSVGPDEDCSISRPSQLSCREHEVSAPGNCQAAATAVRHVVIAAARSTRCVWADAPVARPTIAVAPGVGKRRRPAQRAARAVCRLARSAAGQPTRQRAGRGPPGYLRTRSLRTRERGTPYFGRKALPQQTYLERDRRWSCVWRAWPAGAIEVGVWGQQEPRGRPSAPAGGGVGDLRAGDDRPAAARP